MYKRILDLKPILKRKSLFLLGPRQTGKSTYLRQKFPNSLYINLLKNSEFQMYSRRPEALEETVRYHLENDKNRVVIIDEIQKVPELLDEVHNLIEEEKSLRFILTGSSARKLKRSGVNLLGGRASMFHFYPLCYPELGADGFKQWKERILKGSLPSIADSEDPMADLKDYVGLYLREEISAEGLTRSLDNFARFLDVSALCVGEQINFTSIGSDAQIPPSTVREYFNILEDTLIGSVLPAFLETKKRKAVSSGKFYLFDCGVTNALLGRKDVAVGTPEYGKLLEQAIYVEIKAYLDYRKVDKKFEYWRSTSQFEVDFLLYSNTQDIVAIEVKAGENPSEKDYKGLRALEEEFALKRKIIVCFAPKPRKTQEGIEILPLETFLKKLWQGKIV